MFRRIAAALAVSSTLGVMGFTMVGSPQNKTSPNADWSMTGGNPGNSHYSKLKQINRSNVAKLQVAWTFETGEKGGLETTPIILDGVLYTLTPKQKVVARMPKRESCFGGSTLESTAPDPTAASHIGKTGKSVAYW
jgi:glucose dehydrogenase